MDANKEVRHPGDAEAAGAIAAMRETNWWSVGDLLTYRLHGVGPRIAARVLRVLERTGALLVRQEGSYHVAIVPPSDVVRL